MKKWEEIYLKHSKGLTSTDRSNVLKLNHGIKYILESPIQIEIDAEYFRPKFEEILYIYHEDSLTEGMITLLLDKLIECLKNPEGK